MLYKDYAPTSFDQKGISLPDRQDWSVAPVGQNRDSSALDRSNFAIVLKDLGGESDTVEVHRFGHWGPGWFEIILTHHNKKEKVDDWERALMNYPVADEEHYSNLEADDADCVWSRCYDSPERIQYIREHKSQFEFRGWKDLMSCVRGEYFGGDAGELLR